eukprot:ctg_4485.g458
MGNVAARANGCGGSWRGRWATATDIAEQRCGAKSGTVFCPPPGVRRNGRQLEGEISAADRMRSLSAVKRQVRSGNLYRWSQAGTLLRQTRNAWRGVAGDTRAAWRTTLAGHGAERTGWRRRWTRSGRTDARRRAIGGAAIKILGVGKR